MGERRMERETGAGEKRETGMGERKIERSKGEREREIDRETRVGEREREKQGRKRRSDRGEREKITNTKKIMQFYLAAERSEARQWIVARQVSCYNPLSFFNPVTRDKVGKKMIERETGWERERYN